MRFHVITTPVAQPRQRHRAMKRKESAQIFVHNYTPADHPVQAYKQAIRAAFQNANHGKPIEGPVCLILTFVFPRPLRMVYKKRKMYREMHTAKPDLDNLAKSVKDALNGLAWKDDSQVCIARSAKVYGAGDEVPHVEILIEPIN